MVALNVSDEEEWRDIPGFPGYQASTMGNIRSFAYEEWRILRVTHHPKTGYLAVSPRINGTNITRSVHRLIAAAFIGEAQGRDVNHINGNKHDNRLVNLEYLSRGDNHRHAYRTKIRKPVGLKIREEDIPTINALKGVLTQREIGQRFGVCSTVISRIHHRHNQAAVSTAASSIGA